MQEYELVVVGQSKGNDILGQVKKLVENAHGKVDKIMEWGEKPLAYPIKKQNLACFFLLHLSLFPQNALQFDQTLRVNEQILRHLLVRIAKPKEKKGVKSKPAEKDSTIKPKTRRTAKKKQKGGE